MGPVAGGPVPTQPQLGPHLPAGAVLGPPLPPHKVSSAPEKDLGEDFGGKGHSRAGPCGSDPLLPSRVLGLPGKRPSFRAPPWPVRRDSPTGAEKERIRRDSPKALTSQAKGRNAEALMTEPEADGEGSEMGLPSLSALLAQLP